jgi:hypothetical protein
MFKKEFACLCSLKHINANKPSISPGSKSKVKSSVQRAIRTQLVNTYPLLAPHIDEIIPKKEQLDAMKMCGPTRSPLSFPHYPPHLRLVAKIEFFSRADQALKERISADEHIETVQTE